MKNLNILLIILVLTSCNHSEKFLGLNEGIRHDDFVYSVTALKKTGELSDDTLKLKAAGIFYLVEFQVENQALRVNHPWDNSTAYVSDDNGNIYEDIPSAQQFLNRTSSFGWSDKYLTTAGATQKTWLVFDLPTTVKDPVLMVRGVTLMGDFLNGNKFRRERIRLQ